MLHSMGEWFAIRGGQTRYMRKGEMKRLAILMTGAVLALSVAGNAMAAGSSSCSAYNPQTCSTVTTTTTPAVGGVTTSQATTTSTLPFTGMDVALLLVGGAGLLGAGLVVRRLSRRVN